MLQKQHEKLRLEDSDCSGEARGYPALTESIFEDIDDLGWSLAGEGAPSRPTCGKFATKGCLATQHHPYGRVYVKRVRISCDTRSCPVCVDFWASREAKKAERRLRAFRPWKHQNVVHVVLSPPLASYGKDIRELRREAYRIAKKGGITGGMLVFHPARRSTRGRQFSPHFHLLCYGWVSWTREHHSATGWVVKNLGVRESVGGTVRYLLSHAGVKSGLHCVTWFGKASYRKLRVTGNATRDDQLDDQCMDCGRRLVFVEFKEGKWCFLAFGSQRVVYLAKVEELLNTVPS